MDAYFVFLLPILNFDTEGCINNQLDSPDYTNNIKI